MLLCQVGDLVAKFDSVQQDVGSIQQNVGSIQQNVDSIQQDVGSMQEKVGSIQQNVDSVQQDVINITSQQANVCSNIGSSRARRVAALSDGTSVVKKCEDWKEWIVFQSRSSADVDFYLPWANYTSGFGDLRGNFWLGLNTVHSLCPTPSACQLRIDLAFEGRDYFAV